MVAPAAFFRVKVVALTPRTASPKVALRLPVVLIAVAFAAGVRAVTVGAGPVVKVQLVVVSGLFATSRRAVAPPLRVTVYFVSSTRAAVGSSVATRVAAL